MYCHVTECVELSPCDLHETSSDSDYEEVYNDYRFEIGQTCLLTNPSCASNLAKRQSLENIKNRAVTIIEQDSYDKKNYTYIYRVKAANNVKLIAFEDNLCELPSMVIKPTERNLNHCEFTDYYKHKCSLQKSHMHKYDTNNDSCIWLGIDDNPMHLNRGMVYALLPLLEKFVMTGDID